MCKKGKMNIRKTGSIFSFIKFLSVMVVSELFESTLLSKIYIMYQIIDIGIADTIKLNDCKRQLF